MGCSELNLGIYDVSFRYEEAERLYFAGKIDEAITVLDSEKLPPSAGKILRTPSKVGGSKANF